MWLLRKEDKECIKRKFIYFNESRTFQPFKYSRNLQAISPIKCLLELPWIPWQVVPSLTSYQKLSLYFFVFIRFFFRRFRNLCLFIFDRRFFIVLLICQTAFSRASIVETKVCHHGRDAAGAVMAVVFVAAISCGRASAWKERVVEGPVDSTVGCRLAATTASLLMANILEI